MNDRDAIYVQTSTVESDSSNSLRMVPVWLMALREALIPKMGW